jgi:hypothetical protein
VRHQQQVPRLARIHQQICRVLQIMNI